MVFSGKIQFFLFLRKPVDKIKNIVDLVFKSINPLDYHNDYFFLSKSFGYQNTHVNYHNTLLWRYIFKYPVPGMVYTVPVYSMVCA